MKHNWFLIAVLMWVPVSAQVMVIHRSDGSDSRILLSEIDKITFDIGGTTATADGVAAIVPRIKMLTASIQPNPFGTRITYSLPNAGHSRVQAADMHGRTVRTISDGAAGQGNHTVSWDCRDDAGAPVVSGSYLICIESGANMISRTLFLVK